MSKTDAYVMLITSLPSPESLFLAKRPALSRLKLEQRLRVLSKQDTSTLKLVENAIDWRQFPIIVSETEMVKRGVFALSLITNETLRSIVCYRLELRTCIAALRRRERGEGPPKKTTWGFGRWVNHIERHWTEPTFHLDTVFPWLHEANKKIKSADVNTLERIVLEQAYRNLQQHASKHIFNIEAVIIYVLKWNIIDRITRYNAQAAAKRFEELTLTGLGNFAILFTK